MNNRKSPSKQQRTKNSQMIPITNTNRMRPNSSTGLSCLKTSNSPYRQYSNTNSPVAMSASSLPAVPLFYSNVYADPPDCSSLPKPPESWYLNANDENISPVEIEEIKPIIKQKTPRKPYYKNHHNHNNNNNKGFYNPFCSTRNPVDKFSTPYISVKG